MRSGQWAGAASLPIERTPLPGSNILADSKDASISVGSDGNRAVRPALSADGESLGGRRTRGRK